jgi:lipase chaperone LimK
MAILIAEKSLNSCDNKRIAAFISREFNCTVSEREVALFKAEQRAEELDIESRRIQYYGSNVFND